MRQFTFSRLSPWPMSETPRDLSRATCSNIYRAHRHSMLHAKLFNLVHVHNHTTLIAGDISTAIWIRCLLLSVDYSTSSCKNSTTRAVPLSLARLLGRSCTDSWVGHVTTEIFVLTSSWRRISVLPYCERFPLANTETFRKNYGYLKQLIVFLLSAVHCFLIIPTRVFRTWNHAQGLVVYI